jgi:predicted transcriptional regulator
LHDQIIVATALLYEAKVLTKGGSIRDSGLVETVWSMRICRVKVRVEPEDTYWRGQVQRLQELEKARRTGKQVQVRGAELVFASLLDMAKTLTPQRLELLCLIRWQQPSSVRELAYMAGRSPKNVFADIKALETLGLMGSEGEQKERRRKALRTDLERLEVQIEL